LGALHNFPVQAQQVRALQGFEAEVVVVEVTVIDNLRVEAAGVLSGGRSGDRAWGIRVSGLGEQV